MSKLTAKRNYLRYLENAQLSPLKSIKAKCYDCAPEATSCTMVECPLWPYSPIKAEIPNNAIIERKNKRKTLIK